MPQVPQRLFRSIRWLAWLGLPLAFSALVLGWLARDAGLAASDAFGVLGAAWGGAALVLGVLWSEREAQARAVEALERARMEAESATRAKDELLSALSHELRTPLTAILTWAEVLRRRGEEPAQRARALDVIEHSARLQARLVGDLLDADRLSRGNLVLVGAAVDLPRVVRAAAEGLMGVTERLGVALEIEVERSGWVWGDQTRLEQVCWNVLHNALKFSPRGATVRARVSADADAGWIEVEDAGPGFDAAYLEVPFVRFAPGRAPGRGLGVGLALARELVHRHGGRIELDNTSRLGGARVRIELPAFQPVTERASGARPLAPSKAGPGGQPALAAPAR